jgi:hypothetical protein
MSLSEEGENLSKGILLSLTVQEYYARSLDLPLEGPLASEWHLPTLNNVEVRYIMTFTLPEGASLPPGALGRIRIPCADPGEFSCAGRIAEIKTLMGELYPLAEALADVDRVITRGESVILSTALSNYELGVASYVYIDEDEDKGEERLLSELKEFRSAASVGGWMTAGAYYWTIARLAEKERRSYYQGTEFSEGMGLDGLSGEILPDFETVLARYKNYTEGAFSPERAMGNAGVPAEFPTVAWFNDKLNGALGRYGLNLLIKRLSEGDPIAVLSSLGNFLISAAEVVIGVRVAAMGISAGLGESSSSILGEAASVFTGSISSFAAGLAKGVVLGFGPYLLIISLILISYGFFLAYFLPALPFILWISGVLGWLILVLESLIAAPLWIAAHALPEGEGVAGAHGRKGYLLFLGVLLRPPLMIFGFLLAMALLNGLGRIIGHVFSVFGFDFLEGSFLGISGFMAFSVILGIVIVTAAWKLFGLCVYLPDKVVSWIGGIERNLGEREDARIGESGFKGAGGVSTRMLEPLKGTGKGAAKGTAKSG